MGYSKNKKAKYKKKHRETLTSKLKVNWLQRRPVFLFLLVFAVLMLLFYAFWLSSFFDKHIQTNIVSVNAVISNLILNLLGQNTHSTEGMIFSPAFSISVKRGCDAIEAMALFASAVLAFPAHWKNKLIGFFGGLILLFLLNIVRIVSLFLTGIYYPKAFDMMHVEIWQVVFIFTAIGLWLFWIQKSSKRKVHAAN